MLQNSHHKRKQKIQQILFFSAFFFSQLFCQSQNLKEVQKKYFLAGLRGNYGTILAHSKDIKKLAESNPLGIQLDFSWHFNTYRAFQYCSCLPRLGVSAYYWDYQRENILGRSIAVVGLPNPFLTSTSALTFQSVPASDSST